MSESIGSNGKPTVSVVMPLYNAENTVRDSIQSVLNQTYSDLELIVVDDCSTDEGIAIVEDIAKKDCRVKVIKLARNEGAGVARNTAIEAAEGRYIAFLDADDQWFQTKLAIQIEEFGIKDTALICSGYTIVDRSQKRIDRKMPQEWIAHSDLLKSNVIGCLTAIYDTHQVGKQYMPTIRKRQDYALWLNIIKKSGPAYCIQKELSQYYVQPKSISANKMEMLKWNYRMFRETQNFGVSASALLTLRNAFYKLTRG